MIATVFILKRVPDDNFRCILEYQKKLEQAGVQAKLVLVKDVIHSFFSNPGNCSMITRKSIELNLFSGIYKKANEQVVQAVKEFLDGL